MTRQPRLLFVSLANDPGSDRIVAATAHLGAHCGVIGSADAFAARSRFADDVFRLARLTNYLPESLFLGPRLRDITRAWGPDLIIPLDDLAARVLREARLRRMAGPDVQRLIDRSLGEPANFDTVCSRQGLADLAKRLGVRTPSQEPALDQGSAISAAAAIGYPVVLKREQTCGGVGVAIAPDEASLTRAFRRAWLRGEAKRHLRWIPGFGRLEETQLTLQRYIPGSLAFRAVACADGVVLDGVSFMAERRNPGETGACTVLRAIEREEMTEASKIIVAELGCSGFVAFDFIVTADDKAYLIEMNARPIACGHLGRLFGHDIYAAMIHHLCGTAYEPPEVVDPPRMIALFPRELDRDPVGALLDRPDEVFHDIPRDDPALVEAYAAWLCKRHPDQRALLRRRFKAESTQAASAEVSRLEESPLDEETGCASSLPASAQG
ncbi:MAG: hypothetical protein ACHQAQ_03570 [Hyphomicrobiales bacterium]